MAVNRSIKNNLGLTGRWLYISLMICNSFAMLLFGYDQGVFGKTDINLQFATSPVQPHSILSIC